MDRSHVLRQRCEDAIAVALEHRDLLRALGAQCLTDGCRRRYAARLVAIDRHIEALRTLRAQLHADWSQHQKGGTG